MAFEGKAQRQAIGARPDCSKAGNMMKSLRKVTSENQVTASKATTGNDM
jgi:hypothetical protein